MPADKPPPRSGEATRSFPAAPGGNESSPTAPYTLPEGTRGTADPDVTSAHLLTQPGFEHPHGGPGVAPPPGYELLGPLGRGGMGAVYRARQTGLNRIVALKVVLAGGHATEEQRRRFLAEAEAVAALNHPGIVGVYEFGTWDGQPFLAMEFCPGGSLSEKLGGTPLAPGEAAVVLEELARAAAEAHAKGIVHRDLKPANILLGADGTPKIGDFGLAKTGESASGATATGAILGTPSYMAPEQARGETKDVGPAADIYALGALFYECLTGRPPFRAATAMDTVMQVLSQAPVPPSQLNPRVPRDLETICLKCLYKEPLRRYRTASELADDLHRWQAGEPIAARPAGKLERLWLWSRRNPAVAGLLAGVAVLLLSVAVVATLFSIHLASARRDEQAARVSAQQNAEEAREQARIAGVQTQAAIDAKALESEQRRLAEDREVRLHIATGLRLVEDGDYLAALPSLAQAVWRERDPERASAHRLRFAQVLRACPHLLHFWTGSIYDFVLSPDGSRILIRTTDGRASYLQIRDTATGEPHFPPLRMNVKGTFLFSPDSERFLTIDSDEHNRAIFQLRSAASGQPLGPRLTVPTIEVNAAFTRDGAKVLVIWVTPDDARALRLWDPVTGKDVTPQPLREHTASMFLRAMDTDYFATVSGVDDPTAITLQVWNLATGQPMGKPQRGEHDPEEKVERFAGAFSALGNRMALTIGKTITVWDVNDGVPVKRGKLLHSPEVVLSAAFTSDGNELITTTESATHRWNPVTGDKLHTWKQGRGPGEDVYFSPDGRIADIRNSDHPEDRTQQRLWDWQTDRPFTPPLRHAAPSAGRSFTADSRRLVTLHRSNSDLSRGDICIWDLHATRPQLLPYTPWTDRHKRVCLSPDGRRILVAAKDGVRVHDTETGEPVSPAWAHEVEVAAFSDDGRFLLLGSFGPRTVRVYDVAAGKPVGAPGRLGERPEVIFDAAVSHDGSRFALVRVPGRQVEEFKKFKHNPEIELWDSTRGVVVAQPHSPAALEQVELVKNVAFTPDGRYLLAVLARAGRLGDNELKLPAQLIVRRWQASDGRDTGDALVMEMDQSGFNTILGKPLACQQRFLTLTPDGHRLAVAFGGTRAFVTSVDGRDGGPVPLQHQNRVGMVARSSDGTRLVTASDDHTARVWEQATGKPLTGPLEHGAQVKFAAFRPDGRVVVTIGVDGSVRLWDVTSGTSLGPTIWPPAVQPAPEDFEPVRAAFANGGNMLVLYVAGRAWGYDLTPDDRPAEELVALAEMLSGRRLDTTGVLTPLDSNTLADNWKRLAERYPTQSGLNRLSPTELLAWHRDEGEAAAKNEEWSTAAFHWGRVLAEYPNERATRKAQAHAYNKLGLAALALTEYRKLTELDPNDTAAWLGTGRSFAATGQHGAALEALTRALQLGPVDADVLCQRGDTLASLGRWGDAAANFAAAIQRGRNDPLVWHCRALACLAAGDLEGYHAACAWHVGRFDATPSPDLARQAAWVCSLAPGEKAFYTALAARARAAQLSKEDALQSFRGVVSLVRDVKIEGTGLRAGLIGEPGVGGTSHSPLTANAAVAYRIGQYDVAETVLTTEMARLRMNFLQDLGVKDVRDVPETTRRALGLEGSPWNDLLLAMTYARLRVPEKARAQLASATKRIQALQSDMPWYERLELEMLRHEAEKLLDKP